MMQISQAIRYGNFSFKIKKEVVGRVRFELTIDEFRRLTTVIVDPVHFIREMRIDLEPVAIPN